VITLTRGPDVGGYPNDSVSPDSFVIEVFVTYEAERMPDAAGFGVQDWAVTADDGTVIGQVFEPVMPPNPADLDPAREPLGTYPGAVDVTTTPIQGLLYFEVPREAAERAALLVYRPLSLVEPVIAIPLRRPGPAPDPVPKATPVPTPRSLNYVAKEGLPFTVIDSAGADVLFDSPDTCTNHEGGYTVTYPDDWFTNTQFGEVPACSWFSPTFFEVRDPGEVPKEIVIVITVFDGGFGYFYAPQDSLYEAVTIDGYQGWRREQIGACYEAGGCEALPPSYNYSAVLGGSGAEGPSLQAVTSSEGVEDYELNKAVLDRIMAGFDYDD
jgi:hypothetical protein